MRQKLTGPLDVEFGISSRCQLRCSYCSAMPLLGEDSDTTRTLELIHQLGDLGVFSLLVSGGEPMLHPAILEIVSTAHGRIPITSVNTNGIRHAKLEFARKFFRQAPNTLVAVSLDSADPLLNDLNRGFGGDLACRAIENCVELGQPVCISTVLTDVNLDNAHALIDRFAPSVRKFRFFPRVPRTSDELARNDSIYLARVAQFYEEIKQITNNRPDLDLIVPSHENTTPCVGGVLPSHAGCVCAYTKLYIDSRLQVFPCYYSAGNGTCLGSAATTSIAEMWHSNKAALNREQARTSRLCGTNLFPQSVPVRYLPKTISPLGI